jgi:sec-independent protein translocase protein TatC
MDRDDDREMSLIGHLGELRTRLIYSVLAIVLGMVLAGFFVDSIVKILISPIETVAREPEHDQEITFSVAPDKGMKAMVPPGGWDPARVVRTRFRVIMEADPSTSGSQPKTFYVGDPPNQKVYYDSPLDPFMIKFKVAIASGLLFALPVILYQIWLFICPGLRRSEKNFVKPLLAGAVVLFPLGSFFAFFMVKFILRLMQQYSVEGVDAWLKINPYLSLLFTMMLIFGVIFELPLVIAIGARIGLITPRLLRQYWRQAYVILAIAAMVLTPTTDPFTMMIAYFPLLGLYELSIALAKPMALLHKRDLAENPDDTKPEF